MVIGVTGQSGAGKSSISAMFLDMGFIILEADLIAKDVIDREEECKEKLKKEFGEETILESGQINREILASYAFQNKFTLDKLSKITHPYVLGEVRKRVIELEKGNKNIIIDAAGLFESGINSLCDYTVFVTAPEKDRIERIVKRDKISKDMAIKRSKAQHGDSFYKSRCDFIMKCKGEKSKIYKELKNIIEKIGGFNG